MTELELTGELFLIILSTNTVIRKRIFKKEIGILYVVIAQSQLTRIKKIVNEKDEKGFLVTHDVPDVSSCFFINKI